MDRTRIKLATYVNLDLVPGTFHTPESAQHVVSDILDQSIGHYEPSVAIESYGNKDHVAQFDVHNRNWMYEYEHNLLCIRSSINFLRDKTKSQGYLFLNDALNVFGLSPIREGQFLGWIDDVSISHLPEETDHIPIVFQTHGDILERAFPR